MTNELDWTLVQVAGPVQSHQSLADVHRRWLLTMFIAVSLVYAYIVCPRDAGRINT